LSLSYNINFQKPELLGASVPSSVAGPLLSVRTPYAVNELGLVITRIHVKAAIQWQKISGGDWRA